MNEEEKNAIEELKEFIKGPCEICKFCEGAYKLNRKNIIQVLNLIKKLQKENEELKGKENKIYEEVQESLSFEKFLIKKERKPDSFNQGRFYMSQIIYDILNNFENPDGTHKENKNIKYIDYIPKSKLKDKISERQFELQQEYKDFEDDAILIVLQELLESE